MNNDARNDVVADRSNAVKRKKWWLTGIAAFVVIGVVAAFLWPARVVVDTATAHEAPLTVTVEEQGRTSAKLRYTVAAPISGRLLRTGLTTGDRVKKGDNLAQITPPPTDARTAATARAERVAAEARQRQAAAAQVEADGDAKQAAREAARRAELFDRHLVSAEERDAYAQAAQSADARLANARAAVAAAAAEARSARARLIGVDSNGGEVGAIPVLAPVSGRILRVLEESQRVVDAGTPLFEMSQNDELELIAELRTEDAVQVHAGNAIQITGWGGQDTLVGTVRYVEAGAFTKFSALGVEEQRVNMIGDFVDPPPNLGAEYRIQVAIVTWMDAKVLQIPTGAMFRRNEAWQIFVIEDGRARLRKVEVGHRNAEAAEITAGVKSGDQVIVFPSDLIEEGVRVRGNDSGGS